MCVVVESEQIYSDRSLDASGWNSHTKILLASASNWSPRSSAVTSDLSVLLSAGTRYSTLENLTP